MTRAERKVWYWLRNRYLDGHKFRRQHPAGPFVLDFYCSELMLCIEVDGESHDTDEGAASDERRSRYLTELGITVVRLRNEGVREQPDDTWGLIVDAVRRAILERPLGHRRYLRHKRS